MRTTAATLSSFQFPNIVGTELLTPMSNRFIGDNDGSFSQQIFNIAKAQKETVIKPDGMANDFSREPMAVVARTTGFHAVSLAVRSST